MFAANSRAALNAYRNVGAESIVDSATPQQLVVMLFNGARAAVAAAKAGLQRGDIAAKCKSISHAIAIIDGGLKASLDLSVGGALAQDLSALYAYMGQRLLHANLNNDSDALDEVAQLLAQLGGAWETIATKPVAATTAKTAASGALPPGANRAGAAPAPSQRSRIAAAYGSL